MADESVYGMSAAPWVRMPLGKVKSNPNNPRIIKDDKFRKLVQSIRDFPEMLELRPIVVDVEGVVLGGNMRLRAAKEAGLTDVPVIRADHLTAEQQREFVVKDNVGFGEWDWDALANAWDRDELVAWGMDVPTEAEDKEAYTAKIVAPDYEMTGECPPVESLIDVGKYEALVTAINKEKALPANVKAFLAYAATRHVVFDYQAIAEYYAHAPAYVQRLMEASALVIVDYEDAIKNGFVVLSDSIRDAMLDDYETVDV
jgi:hypothetical protein